MDFSVTYSFWPYHGPGVDSALSENGYQEHFLGVKAAGVWGWQPHHLHVLNVMEIWEPKTPGNHWATPGLLWDSFTSYLFTQLADFDIQSSSQQLAQLSTYSPSHLSMGTDPVLKTVFFSVYGKWTQSKNHVNVNCYHTTVRTPQISTTVLFTSPNSNIMLTFLSLWMTWNEQWMCQPW
jgi:hypothetical protein